MATAPLHTTSRSALRLPAAWCHIARHVVPNLLLNAVAPLLVYAILRPHTTEVQAVSAAALVPLVDGAITFARRRQLNVVGALVFLSLVLSGVLVLLGGSPRLILARESALSGALGVALLVSLLLPQPLIYHIARHFWAGPVPGRGEEFAAKATVPWFRSFLRQLTAVWGVVTVAEAVLTTYLALHLPIATFLAVSPLARYGIMGGTLAWTLTHAHRGQYLAYLVAA